jgi:hypothetical protein
MKQQSYNTITALIFALVAIVHIVRLQQGWTISINDNVLPMWASWAGLVISGLLALWGLRMSANKRDIRALGSSVPNHKAATHMR